MNKRRYDKINTLLFASRAYLLQNSHVPNVIQLYDVTARRRGSNSQDGAAAPDLFGRSGSAWSLDTNLHPGGWHPAMKLAGSLPTDGA